MIRLRFEGRASLVEEGFGRLGEYLLIDCAEDFLEGELITLYSLHFLAEVLISIIDFIEVSLAGSNTKIPDLPQEGQVHIAMPDSKDGLELPEKVKLIFALDIFEDFYKEAGEDDGDERPESLHADD